MITMDYKGEHLRICLLHPMQKTGFMRVSYRLSEAFISRWRKMLFGLQTCAGPWDTHRHEDIQWCRYCAWIYVPKKTRGHTVKAFRLDHWVQIIEYHQMENVALLAEIKHSSLRMRCVFMFLLIHWLLNANQEHWIWDTPLSSSLWSGPDWSYAPLTLLLACCTLTECRSLTCLHSFINQRRTGGCSVFTSACH